VTTGQQQLERARTAHFRDRDLVAAGVAYEAAIEAFGADRNPPGVAESLLGLANLRMQQGWLGEASALVAEARLQLRPAPAELALGIEALVGEIALRSGDRDGARRASARGDRIARRSGANAGLLLTMAARVAQDDGELDEAAMRLERAAEALLAAGDERRANLARIRLALVWIEQGRLDAAIAELEASRASMPVPPDPFVLRESWLYTSAAHALALRPNDAARALDEARRLPGSGTSARHARQIVPMFEVLLGVTRGDDPAIAARALSLAEAPGPDGVAAVNCFYIVRAAARLIRSVIPAEHVPTGKRVRVARDGSWFQLRDGRTVGLAHRPTLARLLAALALDRSPLSVHQLLAAGWPGEQPIATSGTLRVYTTVARLRRLGLEGALLGDVNGYLLDAEIVG
jgi:predicted negative regulator of RcsB-dependent stress response